MISNSAAVPMLLSPALQHYAWRDPTFIPRVLRLTPNNEPFAEAWFGAHPHASARARLGTLNEPLATLIGAQPEWFLGKAVQERFAGMPYLLKVLCAGKPLSIHVHPNRSQAQAGFQREERHGIPRGKAQRCYRDPNHKPELLVALTSFQALCGFRPPAEIAVLLRELPELAELLAPFAPTPRGIRALLEEYFALPDVRLQPALHQLLVRLEEQDTARAFRESEPGYWVLEAHRAPSTNGHIDRGLLFVFLLDLVRLKPGQALFVPVGVPHAYLRGAGIELTANSDNVLRAGLTSKHVDFHELLRVVRFDARCPPILEPVDLGDGVEAYYPVPVAEFELARIRVNRPEISTLTADGPETFLLLGGSPASRVWLRWKGGHLTLDSGQACIVPHGLAYSLEVEHGDGMQLYRARVPPNEAQPPFRGYRPVPLSFCTSGLRGLVSDITELEAYINTRGFLDFLIATGDAVAGTPVALAGDLRPSTDRILEAIARAVRDSGLEAHYCGRIPTPALTYYGIQRGWPSIMVTGSHVPFDRNGIKFNKSTGEVLKADEPEILEAVARVRRLEYERSPDKSLFDDSGHFRADAGPGLPNADETARLLYVQRYLEAFPPQALAGLRVAFYEHSAVGRGMIPEILRGLGAEVHPIGRSDSFVAIDTEAIEGPQLRALQELADELQVRVGQLDAMVSTDGDSDRPLLLGLDVAGSVRHVPGNILGALVAEYLNADAVAVPVSASDLIDRHFASKHVAIAHTRIGSPWVVAALSNLSGHQVVGWETDGGFMTWSPLSLGRKALAPLPTRDAVLPLVVALHAAVVRQRRVVELGAHLPARFSWSGLLDDVAPDASRELLEHFSAPVSDIRRIRKDGETFLSTSDDGSEQALQGADEQRCAQIFEALQVHFDARRGFSPLLEVDYLDGLRLRFQNGDVAHVRPSGNEPQLRIYAVADSEARARQIVRLALAEPDGILRQLLFVADER